MRSSFEPFLFSPLHKADKGRRGRHHQVSRKHHSPALKWHGIFEDDAIYCIASYHQKYQLHKNYLLTPFFIAHTTHIHTTHTPQPTITTCYETLVCSLPTTRVFIDFCCTLLLFIFLLLFPFVSTSLSQASSSWNVSSTPSNASLLTSSVLENVLDSFVCFFGSGFF